MEPGLVIPVMALSIPIIVIRLKHKRSIQNAKIKELELKKEILELELKNQNKKIELLEEENKKLDNVIYKN